MGPQSIGGSGQQTFERRHRSRPSMSGQCDGGRGGACRNGAASSEPVRSSHDEFLRVAPADPRRGPTDCRRESFQRLLILRSTVTTRPRPAVDLEVMLAPIVDATPVTETPSQHRSPDTDHAIRWPGSGSILWIRIAVGTEGDSHSAASTKRLGSGCLASFSTRATDGRRIRLSYQIIHVRWSAHSRLPVVERLQPVTQMRPRHHRTIRRRRSRRWLPCARVATRRS